MADTPAPALRKRQQIENANRTMFLWVAGAAAVVGIAAVLSVSLLERIGFRQEVINEKNKTASTLSQNNQIVDELKANVRQLNVNQALANTPRLDDAEPISVILDGLPATANSSALGASLQQKLLDVNGVTVESLTVNPIAGVEDSMVEGEVVDETGEGNVITFSFIAVANEESSLKEVLRRLERSVRVIDLTSIVIERQNNKLTLTAEGKAFFQPETKVELTEKSVP